MPKNISFWSEGAFGEPIGDLNYTGVRIEERHGIGLATVMGRKGIDAARIGAAIGVSQPPVGPNRVAAGGTALIGMGPDVWMAVVDNVKPAWCGDFAAKLKGLASVSDQTSTYTVVRMTGPLARDILQSGLSLDMHPSSFRPGSAATSVIAYIGVVLWQIDDAPTYEIATFRSFAPSFREWLETTIAGLQAAPLASGYKKRPSLDFGN